MNPSTCSFYGKSGHTEAVCYKKNGFPNNKGKHICTHCGKTGHTVDVWYRKHGFPPKTFNAKTKNVDTKADEEEDMKLTRQQFQALMALIKLGEDFEIGNLGNHIGSLTTKIHDAGNIFSCTNSFHSKQKWILDSGATDHIAMSLE